jgi:phenylacetate-CoA ligase
VAVVSPKRLTGFYNKVKETMPAPARRRYQDAWIAALVEHAWAKAPGVRRRMDKAGLAPKALRTVDDLARLPVIKKAEMPDLQRADPPFGGFCTVPMSRVRQIFVSPGPILEPIGPEFACWHAEGGLYAGGFRRGDIVLNTFSYHLTPAAHMLDEALEVLGCAVVPTGVGNTDTQVAIAKGVGATGYVGTPSFLMTILKRAGEMGAGRLPFQVAQVGAEPFPESMRRAFQEEHGIMARQGFGTADLGMIAYECSQARGMHLVDDAILQVCDPQSGAPLGYGQLGEIVATVRHEGYPMIRFGTGDLTVVEDAPCPCGRTAPRMLGWRGRVDEVTKVRGMFIHPRQVDETAAKGGGATRAQAVVTREGHDDVLTLRVELAPGKDPAAAATSLTSAIREIMKLRGKVEVVPAGTIPENAKKVDDQRKWD